MLRIDHGHAGFFSCCSVRLDKIIDYFNSNKKLPQNVDSSRQFIFYKNRRGDVTFDYFKNYNDIDIDIRCETNIDYYNKKQYQDYHLLDYENITPFVRKYFSPSENIKSIINSIENKYNIDYENTCVLFLRGNDKNTEVGVCSYEEYIEKAKEIRENNSEIKFLIQSDETQFIQRMLSEFGKDSFYFEEEIRHIPKNNKVSVDKVKIKGKNNYQFSKNYLAITIIMSKCKYVICGSGNCSIWIALFRGNAENFIQNTPTPGSKDPKLNKWIY